jgi:NAD(P)-dependent dehydrogenase (short-subunit alcohol dehydrogenase family)
VAAEVTAAHDELHVLINNAGAIHNARSTTVDGIETTFAVNHLAYFLLTELLLDRLRAGAPARIVNVSSDVQRRGQLDWDDLEGDHGYAGFRAYAQSKLANVLFTYELARRLAGTGITANCLHPGVVRSNFGRDSGGAFGFLVKLGGPLMISAERGAETSLYLATAPELADATGGYYVRKKLQRTSPRSYDEADARRLWEVSEAMTGIARSDRA